MTSPLPLPIETHRGAYLHFSKRVSERLCEHEDPIAHWWKIVVAIERQDAAVVEFMGRLNRAGRRLWRYNLQGKPPTYVVFDHANHCPVTILTQERPLRCGSKKQRLIIDGVAYGL